jgi:chemotaxis protein methyltransferase WspC
MNAHQLLQRETGLDLAPKAVERAVATRMSACGMDSGSDYLRRITPGELAALVELVVVPESWMFRDPEAFAAATELARERLAQAPARQLRFLSVPCASGEEPYTIAMALQDAGIAPSSYLIDAVDLSAAAIARARRGRYTKNAFRGGKLEFRDRYFTRVGEEYEIAAPLRAQVNFAQGNLLAFDVSAQAGRYDVIFCRNLLIYFDEPTCAAAAGRLATLLADDGVLFAGYAEVPAFCQNGFAPLRHPGAFALRKQGTSPAPAASRAPAVRLRPARAAPARLPPRPPEPAPAPAAPPEPLLERAQRLADQGELDAAGEACRAALQADPNCAEGWFILGMLSDCRNDSAAAAEYWRRCVYLQPGHYQALCHLAAQAEAAGEHAAATAFKRRAARVFQRTGGDQ